MSLVQKHDPGAFAYLYSHYRDAVYGLILQFLPAALGPTFSWGKFYTYDPAKGKLFTWLHGIARNQCIDVLWTAGYRSRV